MGLLANGERGEIVGGPAGIPAVDSRAAGHTHKAGCGRCGCAAGNGGAARLEDMGLRPGKVVEMLSNEGRGALLVKVNESRIAVGRGVAMKILVRRTGDESRDAQAG